MVGPAASRGATRRGPDRDPLAARRSGPAPRPRRACPGDKSISHRALILGALTVGETRITGLLEGEDVINTGRAMRALGRNRRADRAGRLAGQWRRRRRASREPAAPLDFGNSGTGCRLVIGAVAGCPITATFDGDASLRSRPMQRVLDPLARMGAQAVSVADGGRLPLTLKGARDPIPIVYQPPAASAQLKSAVLLAGLAAPGETIVVEAEATRDHTERMLRHFGAEVAVANDGAHGRRITLKGQPELVPAPVVVPADPSSAAFPMVAALIVPGSDIVLDGVMLNVTRTGLFKTLREMGASIEELDARVEGGEDVADLRVRASRAQGRRRAARARAVHDRRISRARRRGCVRARHDAHARAEGAAREGIRPARRDRRMLRVNGVDVEIEGDDLIVHGNGRVAGGGLVTTHMDHRIAMSALVMGLASEKPVHVDDTAFIATSFPGFVEMMRRMGGELS